MTPNEYNKALEKAVSELESRVQARDILNAEIAGLRETVRVLASRAPLTTDARQAISRLLDMVDYATPSLADSIRAALTRVFPRAMTAVEVRNALEELQFNFDDFSNPLSACHAALKRMLNDKEVGSEQTKDGKTAYRKTIGLPPPPPPRSAFEAFAAILEQGIAGGAPVGGRQFSALVPGELKKDKK